MPMKPILTSILYLFATVQCLAQVEQAWVQRYSLVSDRANQTVAIALAPDGGVIVGGYSATTNADLDYMVLKFAPGGAATVVGSLRFAH